MRTTRRRTYAAAIAVLVMFGAMAGPVATVVAKDPQGTGSQPKQPPSDPPDRNGVSLAEKAAASGSALAAEAAAIGDLQVIPYDGANVTATRLAERIMGGRGTITNARLTGANRGAGLFLGGASTVGVRDGLVLSSGDVNSVLGPNFSDGISTSNGLPGDAALDTLLTTGTTFDATVLEFDMTPSTNILRFDFVFASDEYNEYANTAYNDVFGFFIDGTNVAWLPDGQTRVSVNSINGGNPLGSNAQNAQFYVNNDLNDGGGAYDTEMDGFTTVLSVTHWVDPGITKHVKLAIADTGDRALDSNVLIGGPDDCGSFNLDSAVPPEANDPADVTNITVKYDPRLLVPENQPNFEANARLIAEAVRKRADRAVARYRELGSGAAPEIEVQIVCDIGAVDPINIDDINIGPINIDAIPETTDGFVESEKKVKLRAAAIRNEFKTTVQAGFPAGGDWNTAKRYWASLVDHEIFHTVQVNKVGGGVGAFDQMTRGSRLTMESGAVLGEDLQVDADNLPDQPGNGSEYIDWIRGMFDSKFSLESGAYYNAAAVFQYWGERYGAAAASRERQVLDWYMRLIQPLSLAPRFDPDTGLGAMAEVLGPVNLYDALRDFFIAAYVRQATNVKALNGPNAIYRFLDEEDLPAPATYPTLAVAAGDLAAGPVTLVKDRNGPLMRAGTEVYEIALPSDATQVQVTIDAEPTGGVGFWNWFPGSSPLRVGFIASQPGRTGTVQVSNLTNGPKPDEGVVTKTIPVAGRSKLAIVVVASEDDAAYTIVVTKITGTAGLTIDAPTSSSPANVTANAADQGVMVTTRPTINGVPATGLDATSFTAKIGSVNATVSAVLPIGDKYFLFLDPTTRLAAGTYSVQVTYSGVTRTQTGAVIAGAAPPGPNIAAVAASGAARANLFVSSAPTAGTPIHAGLMLTEPGRGIPNATVTAAVTDPSGRTRVFGLRDNGADGDAAEDDGVYAADLWATDLSGTYAVVVSAAGTDSTGTTFTTSASATVVFGAKVDTDGDGIANLAEARFGLNPNVADDRDLEGDGLSLASELREGSDPWQWDTDGGGENDASEVAAGRNPLSKVDDGEVRSLLLNARSIDGSRFSVEVATNDGGGSVRLYRMDGSSAVVLGTFAGTGATVVDGPLAAGTYGYAAVAIGPTGAVSSPLLIGPYSPRADATLPTARLEVAGGRWETSNRNVPVAFFDLSEVVTQMRLAESASALSTAAWVPFAESSTFTIGAQAGQHVIFAQVRDASGLASPVMSAPIDLDVTLPSSTLGAVAPFNQATVTIPFSATDGGSFVANVELWVRSRPSAAAPWGAWALEASSPSSPIVYLATHGDGLYEFYSIAADGAGNRELAPATADASTTIDSTAPSSNVSALPATSGGSSISVPFIASDALSGVGSVELWARFRATSTGTWGAWVLAVSGAASPLTYSFSQGNGFYEFYTVAIDRAGNREAPPATADATTQRLSGDTTPPTSAAGGLIPLTTASSIQVPYTASDNASGVASVELWYRYRKNEVAGWSVFKKAATATTSPITFNFTDGDGNFEFYTIAVDGAGNRETAPATADAFTRRDAVDDPPDFSFSATATKPKQCSHICPTGARVAAAPVIVTLAGGGTAVDDRMTVTVTWRLFGVKADGTSKKLFDFKSATPTDGSFNSRIEAYTTPDQRTDAGYTWYDVEVKATAGLVSTSRIIRIEIKESSGQPA